MPDMLPIQIHRLVGCRPTPLAHYLKAIGLARVITEQIDPKVRGWWEDDVFHLSTVLSQKDLEEFFLNHYAPTPLVAPWNGGSGFFPKDNQVAINAIASSSAKRFQPYRDAIHQCKAIVAHLKEKPEKGESKNNVIASCRRTLRGAALDWIDAALAMGADGDPVFPAMLGTGGNDGRLDFTTNFMQRLTSLFHIESENGGPQPPTYQQLRIALWDAPSPTLSTGAIGQFLPGAAGGPNGTTGFAGSFGVNPWDFVLMLEGAVLFSSGLSRRCQAKQLPQAAAPFAVRNSGAGYGSADQSDAGPRGEQWMPLWSYPTRLRELAAFLREGRCQINGKPAVRGIDMARSIAKMGVARGVDQFERYGYIERNGLSNLAIPLGRFQVCPRPNQRLLDEVAPWIDRLRQASTDKLAPNSFLRVYRSCEQAAFNCAQYASPADFLELLIALGEAEDQMLASPKFSAEKCVPIPELSPQWYKAIAEDSAEFRLAVALVSQFGPLEPRDSSDTFRWATIRQHWIPLDSKRRQFVKSESGLNLGPEQSARGLDLERASIAILHRRFIALNRGASINSRDSSKHLPLRQFKDHLGATWSDIAMFLNRQTDDAKLLAIARGIMSIRWHETEPIHWSQVPNHLNHSKLYAWSCSLFGVIRLALPTESIRNLTGIDIDITCDASIFRRLVASDFAGAFQLAVRRLSNAGLRPKFTIATGSSHIAQRLAASLIFGIQRQTRNQLALAVTAADDST